MTTAEKIEEMMAGDPNNLYWAIEQEHPGKFPESLGVDFSGYPFDDGSGFIATETEDGNTLYERLDNYRDGLTAAVTRLGEKL